MKTIVVALMMVWCVSPTRAQWQQVSQQFTGKGGLNHIYTLFVHGSNIFAIADSAVFETSDDGLSWIRNNISDSAVIACMTQVGENVIALSFEGRSWLSTNNGITWNRRREGVGGAVNCLAIGSRITCTSTWEGVNYSDDTGNSWYGSQVSIGGHSFWALCSVESILFTVGLGSVHDETGGISRSSDGGHTWETVPITFSLFGSPVIFDFVGLGTAFLFSSDSGLYRSYDKGLSFSLVNAKITDSLPLSYFATYGPYLFGSSNGVLVSRDTGNTWSDVSEGLPLDGSFPIYVISFAIHGGYLFAGSNGVGVWRRPLSDFGLSSVANSTSITCSLSLTAYPDPTTTRTTISFTLPASGTATLTLTDAAGREWPLVASAWFATGEHHLTWDASKYPSGVYLCRLIAGERSCSAKVAVSH